MANNPFSDFSALKSLKKELEKKDDAQNPSKPAKQDFKLRHSVGSTKSKTAPDESTAPTPSHALGLPMVTGRQP